PQTREHLTVLEISGIKNIVVVQNKVDLVSQEQAQQNHAQIQAFLKGSVAEGAPVIPVSAQQKVNLDALIQAVEERIPTPQRDPAKPPKLLVARSFDINKPGTPVSTLKGGIIGGSLVQGQLAVGDDIEILPGVKVKDNFVPLRTKVTGLQKAMTDLPQAGPGGLLGVATELDPAVTKSDSLSGNIAGKPGQLPPARSELAFASHLLERVVGAKEELKVEPIRTGEPLLLTVGISRTVGAVSAAAQKKVTMRLKIPVVTEKGERIAISRQVAGRWRLIGWGEVA
ncbi:MAG TPA: translation initiation factor IF-2 subunit gamma, partial [archaeon]|nr:translation initiation factor IF-2 subunit gamma [archaeon]